MGYGSEAAGWESGEVGGGWLDFSVSDVLMEDGIAASACASSFPQVDGKIVYICKQSTVVCFSFGTHLIALLRRKFTKTGHGGREAPPANWEQPEAKVNILDGHSW